MIIGRGNIASAINDRDDVTFFASGVSNSEEIRTSEFNREKDLLLSQDKERHLVYFSSLSIYYNSNEYNKHKKRMEQLVRDTFKSYTIVRVEVIAWGRNPTTIHNVFRQKLCAGNSIEIKDTTRYVLEKWEFQNWLKLIPVGEKNEMNIPGRSHEIIDILKMVKEGKL